MAHVASEQRLNKINDQLKSECLFVIIERYGVPLWTIVDMYGAPLWTIVDMLPRIECRFENHDDVLL